VTSPEGHIRTYYGTSLTLSATRTRSLSVAPISRAKVIADRVSLDVTSQVFEAVGGRGATAGVGLDRFWRDARTYTLHDSVAIKKREIGAFVLRGCPPTPIDE
jgi:alkylation response protein AidB-like acyl-CoA dehydrogenase